MALKAFRRYEKKFSMTEEQMNQLLPLIGEHMDPDRFCINGQVYSICNVYYDTEDSAIIRHSLSKPFYKEKLRMRSYGTPTDPNALVFLEMKKKIHGLVTKRRAEIPYQTAMEFMQTKQVPDGLDYMNTQVLREIAYFLEQHHVHPTVFISYERSAYFDRNDSQFRLTFDRNILTRRTQVDLAAGNFGTLLMPENFRLMEVKVSTALPTWLADALCDMNLFSSSFSKYGREYHTWLEEKMIPFSPLESGTIPLVPSPLSKNPLHSQEVFHA